MNLHFTKYRISTITSNAKILLKDNEERIDINLITLFDNININDNDESECYVYTSRFENKSSVNKIVRGNYIKKKRTIQHKRTFDNQISFVYKFADNYYVNVKVFQNGSLHITGSRKVEDIAVPLEKLIKEIKDGNINILKNEDYNINDVIYADISILMINTDFKIFKEPECINKFSIKRRTLHTILINDYNMIARFDPSTYPGVKIEYWWNSENDSRDASNHYDKRNVKSKSNVKEGIKKITIAVFESGSILITGAITIEQVDETYKFICDIIEKNKEIIYFNI
jgi:TATA-box binding protein (TBP) (component of TFIID and TFIIIB)|tara:strand:- start:998 stop:1852 length:855 start_codon:yes stop_codon:yes gene_type:complete